LTYSKANSEKGEEIFFVLDHSEHEIYQTSKYVDGKKYTFYLSGLTDLTSSLCL
jgi:hypothetical protein